METTYFSTEYLDGALTLTARQQAHRDFRRNPALMLEAFALFATNGTRLSPDIIEAMTRRLNALDHLSTATIFGYVSLALTGEDAPTAFAECEFLLKALCPALSAGMSPNAFSPYKRATRALAQCPRDVSVRLAVILRSVCANGTSAAEFALDRLCDDETVKNEVSFLLSNLALAAFGLTPEKRAEITASHGARYANILGQFLDALSAQVAKPMMGGRGITE